MPARGGASAAMEERIAGGARRASGLGRAQDRALSGARGHAAAGALDGARDPAPAWPRSCRRPGGAAATQRFEKPAPNLLWQMDFKGWVQLADGSALPSADRDRRSFALSRCASRPAPTSRATPCRAIWRRPSAATACRMPCSSTMAARGAMPRAQRWTQAWRVAAEARRRGAPQPTLSSAEPRQERALPPHAQGRGASRCGRFRDLAEVQRAFDRWREVYNFERPHEALGQDVPASRYRPSPAPCRSGCRQSGYDERRDRPHGLAPPRTTSASRDASGTSRKPSAANAVAIRPLSSRRPIRHLLRRPPDRRNRLAAPTVFSRRIRSRRRRRRFAPRASCACSARAIASTTSPIRPGRTCRWSASAAWSRWTRPSAR